MASKFLFPEIRDDDPYQPFPEASDEGFAPLFAGSAPARPSLTDTDDWRPMHGQADSRPTGRIGAGTGPAAGVGTPPAAPGVPRPPDPAPPVVPRVDPRELERIRAQARDEGYREGLARGEAEGRNNWKKRIEQVEHLILSLGGVRESLFHLIREDVIKIMTLVPRKILRQALQINPQAIASMVGSILEELPRQERVVVKVAPEDLRLLEEALPDLKRRLGGYTQVEIEPSAQVTGGGAQLVTEGGRIDATIERQLETFEMRAREWILGATGPIAEVVEASGYDGTSNRIR